MYILYYMQVIVCTDGLANKGLGSLDGKQPYHIVGNLANGSQLVLVI